MLQRYTVSHFPNHTHPSALIPNRFLDTNERGIHMQTTVETRNVAAITCAIGITPSEFSHSCPEAAVQFESKVQALKSTFSPYRLILGVDRIDYTKGLPAKLRAFAHFLATYPQYIGKVILLQIGVPSRESLPEIQALLAEIYSLVGSINAQYGTLDYTPVRFLHTSIPRPQLAALYAAADVCLITARRDGMNLVSFEYVACQRGRDGVLVLGKEVGSATLLVGAVLVDATEEGDVAKGLGRALGMQSEERRERQERSWGVVKRVTSEAWGKEFVRRLRGV
jgi:trehalose-6-phosphate synthase